MAPDQAPKQEEWHEMYAFLDKVLGSRLVSRQAAVFLRDNFKDNGQSEAQKMLGAYFHSRRRMSEKLQAKLVRKLLEADGVEGVQQLINDGDVSTRDLNNLLDAFDPLYFHEMIVGPVLYERGDADYKKIKIFIEKILNSGAVNWVAASIAHGNFQDQNVHEFAVVFYQHAKHMTRPSFASLMNTLELVLQAESCVALRRMVEDGVLLWNDLEEMMVVFSEEPEKFLAYIKDKEYRAAAIERHQT